MGHDHSADNRADRDSGIVRHAVERERFQLAVFIGGVDDHGVAADRIEIIERSPGREEKKEFPGLIRVSHASMEQNAADNGRQHDPAPSEPVRDGSDRQRCDDSGHGARGSEECR